MTSSPRPWPRMHPLRRWGPTALVLAVLVAASVIATTHTNNKKAVTAAASGDPAANPELPITYQQAQQAGTTSHYDWGPGCDKTTGRLAMPSVYAPPCVPVPTGDNGGATAPGVTATTITVVLYQPPPGDLASALSGNLDPPDAQWATAQKIVDSFNHIYQLSGRQVRLIRFQGTGISTDETAARADAVKVADDLHAFASLSGPAQTPAYQDELSARGVLCIGCGVSVDDAGFQKDAPHLWGQLATPDQLLRNVFDYVTSALVGHKAEFAGDPSLRSKTRVFGAVHYDQDPPIFGPLTQKLDDTYGKKGYKVAVNESYLLDLAQLPTSAATIVGHLKQAGVTTVVFIGDPIMPIYLTKAATAQHYFPEWIVTGTVLTDTTALARLYDPTQWAHAFGISSLAVPVPQNQSEAWRLYHWWYGTDSDAPKTITVIEPPIAQLFLGIHMAGPHLTDVTFEGGMFKYPPTGGGPTTPRISYGHHGITTTPDFVGVDDTTLIWWDAKAVGADEQGKVASGHYRYVAGGKRYLPGQLPKTSDGMFKTSGSVLEYTLSNQPAIDRAPNEPAWPGSPAAGH